MHKPTQSSPEYQLSCLEVWGGSGQAKHTASVQGLDVHITSNPVGNDRAGGDLYLLSSCSSGWISRMLIADISGHGEQVAHLSSKLRKIMHKNINTVDQSMIARSLNKSFDEISKGSRFATALMMTYFAPTGHLVLVNAGHPPPLVYQSKYSRWLPMDPNHPNILTTPNSDLKIGLRNLPLGVIQSTEYTQIALPIQEEDHICAYTDAYIECAKDDGSLLGVDGLTNVLNHVSCSSDCKNNLTESVRDEISARGYSFAEDDHTLMHIRHNGQSVSSVGVQTVKNYLSNLFGRGHTDTYVGTKMSTT